MKIGLINIEPKVVNTALMQISFHHKKLGHKVQWARPFTYDQFDMLYCSSLFTYTYKKLLPKRTICGGTGFDLTTTLAIDCDYDYSIYPKCNFSIVWFSRGCIRNCPFCIAQQKEGWIKEVDPKPLNPKGVYIKVQDNNFFACPSWRKHINKIVEWGQPVTMEGVDVRLLEPGKTSALMKLKHEKQIKIAWDNPKQNLVPALKKIIRDIPPYKLMCYVLIGYDSTPQEDYDRIEALRSLEIDPFVMPYDKKNRYQKRFARWVNHKAIYKSVAWEDYKKSNYKQVPKKTGPTLFGVPERKRK